MSIYIFRLIGNLTYHSHGMNIPNSPELLRFQHEYIPKKRKRGCFIEATPFELIALY